MNYRADRVLWTGEYVSTYFATEEELNEFVKAHQFSVVKKAHKLSGYHGEPDIWEEI